MSDTPFDNGRDAGGRFTKGNQAAIGRGNPHADQAKAVRDELWQAVDMSHIRLAVKTMVKTMRSKNAKDRDRLAGAVAYLNHYIGKLTWAELLERIERLERLSDHGPESEIS